MQKRSNSIAQTLDYVFLSNSDIPGVTLCFCTGLYAARAAAGRRL